MTILKKDNLTFEEFVILSSDAKTNKLLGNEAMNSLDAKVKLSTEFQNNPEFLNFCIENIFKMHHQVSYLFLLQTITDIIVVFFKTLFPTQSIRK